MNPSGTPQQLIMIVGIPGSGKRAEAKKILEKMEEDGYHQIDGESLYPVLKAEDDSPWIIDISKAVSALRPQKGDFKGSVNVISPSSIREERRKAHLPANDDMVALITNVRIRQAVLNGSSVIYSAENSDTASRENVLRLVGDKPDIYRKLVLIFKRPDPVKDCTDYLRLERMAQGLHDNKPSEKEGWNEVIQIGEDPIQEKILEQNDDFDAPSM